MKCATLPLTIGFLALAAPGAAQAPPELLWTRQFGTSMSDGAQALAPDGAGGAFVAGTTTGSLGGPITGFDDPWLARYDSAGSQLWIRQFGTLGVDTGRALASDGAGGVFIAGETWGSLGGPYIGNSDNWLARYDGAGNQLWIRQFGIVEWDIVWALAPDGAGGVFAAGVTGDALGGTHFGGSDAWLARYDGAGNQLWIRQLGTIASEQAYALAPDGSGGVFIGGTTDGSLGGPRAGGEDAWLARYDSAGNQLWIRQFGTSEFDPARALAADGAGGAFIAGITSGSLGGLSAGKSDAWLARYNSAGDRIWIRQFGTSEIDSAWALAHDSAGGAFVAGDTHGSLAGPGAGDADGWLARYDSAGDQLWIDQLGTTALDEIRAVTSDSAEGALVAGGTRGSLGGPSAGGVDAWLARYADTCPADCDADGSLTFFDFLCFQNLFAAGDPGADCDGDGTLTFFDFLCFQNAFAAGCP